MSRPTRREWREKSRFAAKAATGRRPAASRPSQFAPPRRMRRRQPPRPGRPTPCRGASPKPQSRAVRFPPPATAQAVSTSGPATASAASLARRAATRSSGVDSRQQHQARAKPSPAEAHRAADGQRERGPDQHRRPHRGFHQLLGREIFNRRQQVAARPVGPVAARGLDEWRWKSPSWSARSTSKGSSSAAHGNPPRSFLDCRAAARSIAGPNRQASPRSSRADAHRPRRRPPSAIRASIRSKTSCCSSSGTVPTADSGSSAIFDNQIDRRRDASPMRRMSEPGLEPADALR